MKRLLLVCCMVACIPALSSDLSTQTKQDNKMLARTNYAELGLPVGPYTHAVSHSNTLYTSGMTAFATPAEKQDINKQLEEIFRQIAFICEQHQTSLQQLIKVTLFVTSFEEIQQARQTLFNIYGEHIPASSLIRVNSLFSPDLKVEVEAIISLSNKEN